MWTSRNEGARVALGKSRVLGVDGDSAVARVEMERMRPSSTARMGCSRRLSPSHRCAAVKTVGIRNDYCRSAGKRVRETARQRVSKAAGQRGGELQILVDELGIFGGGAVGAGLEGLERGLEGGHFGAGGDELGG